MIDFQLKGAAGGLKGLPVWMADSRNSDISGNTRCSERDTQNTCCIYVSVPFSSEIVMPHHATLRHGLDSASCLSLAGKDLLIKLRKSPHATHPKTPLKEPFTHFKAQYVLRKRASIYFVKFIRECNLEAVDTSLRLEVWMFHLLRSTL